MIRCRFRTTTNTIDFVNSNSDVPYDSTYIAKKDLPCCRWEINLPPGQVYGPYIFGKYYCISKSWEWNQVLMQKQVIF
jgi:peptidyl-prolyl cis-trans isomerase D